MAWLESSTGVCVVELRTRTLWERRAQTKSGRGRVRLVGDYPDEAAAAVAYRARIAMLETEGYRMIDDDVGVDALHPRRERAAPQEPKLTVNELLSALRRSIAALPEQPQLAVVLDAMDRILRAAKLSFRPRAYLCDLGVRGTARLVLQVGSSDGAWREVGCAATLDLPEDRETEEERLDSDHGGWRGFVSLVRADAAWNAVADVRCTAVELIDDEID